MKTHRDGVIPFIFRIGEVLPATYVVIVAHFDYTGYNSRWMNDPLLGDRCLVPDVDLTEEEHSFDTEQEALTFVAKWWSQSSLVEGAVDKFMNKTGRRSA